jgi:hypothetical protein
LRRQQPGGRGTFSSEIPRQADASDHRSGATLSGRDAPPPILMTSGGKREADRPRPSSERAIGAGPVTVSIRAAARCAAILSLLAVGCAAPPTPPVDTARPTPPPAPTASEDTTWRYALVIDASSSASWLQIYQWRSTPDNGLPEIQVAPYPRNRDTAAWEKKVSGSGPIPRAASRVCPGENRR